MFKNLLNFSYKRNPEEALGFYLAFLALAFILNKIFAALFGSLIVIVVYPVFCLIISSLIVKKKKLSKSSDYLNYLIGVFLTAVLAGVSLVTGFGPLLGLIIPASLTQI
jgi:hypothetical protein